MTHDETRPAPVVVVGAGLGGTAAAAFLAHAGVATVVLDRRTEPSRRPRARMVSARSQELFRLLGLAEQVCELGETGSYEIHVVDTMDQAPITGREPDRTLAFSPTGAALCDQDLLEGLLREYAESHGAEFRWGRAATRLVDGDAAVEVALEAADSLRARYVILAEGGRAELRGDLGLNGLAGSESDEFSECLFRSRGLDELMTGRPGAGFVCTSTGASFLRRDAGRWTITRYAEPLTDPVEEIALAVGRRVDVEVLSEGSWRPSAQLATSFRSGRVFVVGDAAHSMPPSVGMAGNLAIADAHNLAWKLAWVLRGDAGPRLLDSYDAERRPAAKVVLDEALFSLYSEPDRPLPVPVLQLGIGYPPAPSPALLSEDFEQPLVDPGTLTPRIGVRLAHQWLPDGRSTVDLTDGTGFVTVGAHASVGGPVPHYRIDTGDNGNDGDDGRVWLVRPDGHVAARVRPADVADAIDRVLDRPAQGSAQSTASAMTSVSAA